MISIQITEHGIQMSGHAQCKGSDGIDRACAAVSALTCKLNDTSKMVHRSAKEQWRGDNFSGRLWKNQKQLAMSLNDVLLTGLQQGKTVTSIAVSLHDKVGNGFSACHRLVRTETMYYLNSATLQRYKNAGVKHVKIWAAQDERMCETCGNYHGKIYPIDKCPVLPFHANCRCTIIPVTDESAIKKYEKEHGIAEEKEESKKNPIYENTVINKKEIDSNNYRKRFDHLSDDKNVNRSAWNIAKQILNHRNGTKYEDLAFIDSITGKYKINKDYSVENKAKPNKPMKKMLSKMATYSIIAVHNHPGSSVPSMPDILACMKRKYKYGVVVCHDGKIYKYSVNEAELNKPMVAAALEKLQKNGYTLSVKKMFNDAGVKMEVL